MFSAIRQARRASLPDETPTACEHPEYAAMAFSHCSTFGPRIKCWDSRTSVIAASTSDLIDAYCALRSSSGIFIVSFLLELPVRLGADTQVDRQRGLFVEVKAANDARFNFFVAVTGLRTPHHSLRIGRIKTMAVPAHPPYLARWVPND